MEKKEQKIITIDELFVELVRKEMDSPASIV